MWTVRGNRVLTHSWYQPLTCLLIWYQASSWCCLENNHHEHQPELYDRKWLTWKPWTMMKFGVRQRCTVHICAVVDAPKGHSAKNPQDFPGSLWGALLGRKFRLNVQLGISLGTATATSCNIWVSPVELKLVCNYLVRIHIQQAQTFQATKNNSGW